MMRKGGALKGHYLPLHTHAHAKNKNNKNITKYTKSKTEIKQTLQQVPKNATRSVDTQITITKHISRFNELPRQMYKYGKINIITTHKTVVLQV